MPSHPRLFVARSMVTRRVTVAACVADFDSSRLLRDPVVNPECLSDHGTEVVCNECAIRGLKLALSAVLLFGWLALCMRPG